MNGALPRCAVIIPTYNGAGLTRACLLSLFAHPPSRCEQVIVVVDDASTDGTQDLLAGYGDSIRVVTHEHNGGFATACNDGARAAGDCEYLVFLNNDTLVTAGWLDALVDEAVSHQEAAAIGAKLLFPNGMVQHAGVAIGRDGWPHHLYSGFPDEHPAVNHAPAGHRRHGGLPARAPRGLRGDGRLRRRLSQRL